MKTRSFGNATMYTFENKNGMVMEVTDFGAVLYSLMVPDKDGNLVDVNLGYATPEAYGKQTSGFGATIGRNGNRIGGAKFTLNGKVYELTPNNNGNNLHSGLDFYQHRMWNVKETTENSITLSLHSPDGDQGFPGNFDVDVTYTLTDDNELKIDYNGVTDADTVINMTNHSYFNLNGHASGNILEHELWVDADAFTATDDKLIPTGEIRLVEGSPMDFRVKKLVGRDIDADYDALNYAGGYDHNWCLNNNGEFKKVIEISSDLSGITMEVYTDLPGVQIYAGNFLVSEPGKSGATYKKRQGICFETQHYPDAINHENFPSPIVKKGEVYKTTTVYKFV
ncbi:MAG: galactose mutarotase [Tyzzerella sp.]|nr:galactose mutarotase [Tyzzerella sp.]